MTPERSVAVCATCTSALDTPAVQRFTDDRTRDEWVRAHSDDGKHHDFAAQVARVARGLARPGQHRARRRGGSMRDWNVRAVR